ncbi:hypothetical protein [Gracilimonas sediminicola]|uniref:hypothetical protein n=1 Tax=Gracilimonas sediminicola TaxID=2952158 RepID=UPI0038D436D8
MQLQTKTVRKGINKAFLKELVERPEFDNFKRALSWALNQILTAKKENPEAGTSKLEAEIDRLVYELYGLSEEEIGIVEGV